MNDLLWLTLSLAISIFTTAFMGVLSYKRKKNPNYHFRRSLWKSIVFYTINSCISGCKSIGIKFQKDIFCNNIIFNCDKINLY